MLQGDSNIDPQNQLEPTGHASVNLRSSVVVVGFFLLPWLEREKTQIPEITGEGMIAGYASVHWTTSVRSPSTASVNSDNSSLREIYTPSLW